MKQRYSVLTRKINSQKCKLFVGRMEEEILSLTPMDSKQKKAKMGRNDGPRFVMKPALGDEIAGPRQTTAVSRAWRKTAGWLDDLQKSTKVVVRAVAKDKIWHYNHPPPAWVKATAEQHESFAAFKRWKKIITAEMLQSMTWIKLLRKKRRLWNHRQSQSA